MLYAVPSLNQKKPIAESRDSVFSEKRCFLLSRIRVLVKFVHDFCATQAVGRAEAARNVQRRPQASTDAETALGRARTRANDATQGKHQMHDQRSRGAGSRWERLKSCARAETSASSARESVIRAHVRDDLAFARKAARGRAAARAIGDTFEKNTRRRSSAPSGALFAAAGVLLRDFFAPLGGRFARWSKSEACSKHVERPRKNYSDLSGPRRRRLRAIALLSRNRARPAPYRFSVPVLRALPAPYTQSFDRFRDMGVFSTLQGTFLHSQISLIRVPSYPTDFNYSPFCPRGQNSVSQENFLPPGYKDLL